MDKIKIFIKKKKKSILRILGTFLMLAIAAAIGIMLGLKKTNDINKYINEAVEYFSESNWVALYNYSEVSDSTFINEITFGQTADALYGEISESHMPIIEEIDEYNKNATARLSYTTSDGENKNCQLEFDKKDITNYIFFPQWKLNIDEMIATDCKLVIKDGFKVYLDGIELTNENSDIISDKESGAHTYTISKIFKGEHVIYLKGEDVEVIEANVTWAEDSMVYEMNASDIELVQSQKDVLNDASKNIVVGMYSAIFEESGIDDLKKYFAQSESVVLSLQGVYDNMLKAVNQEDGSTLNSIDVTAFNYDAITYTYPNKAEVKVSFECTFKARGPRPKKGGIREKYEGTSESEITLQFVKNGEEWICESVDMECIDYSKKEK